MEPGAPLRVAHVITGLSTGGAEMMLYKLVASMDREAFHSIVISLRDKGTIGARIEALGGPVHTLGCSPGRFGVSALLRLRSILERNNVGLVQAWMYHSNVAATAACMLARHRCPIIWNIRQSRDDSIPIRLNTALVIRIGSIVSSFPTRIVYNSRVSAEQHRARGYAAERSVVIANGFDCTIFKPNLRARDQLREELGLSNDTVLIGMVARYHPMKDHANFLRAAAILSRTIPKAQFVLVGNGVNPANAEIKRQARTDGLADRVHLLGEREDIAHITAGLDLFCLSSAGCEGFPNAVGEAMACGVPCVVTNVGDAAVVVGDTGSVVPPRDPAALAAAWARLIEAGHSDRRRMGAIARQRILDNFSLPRIADLYENLYRDAVQG